MKQAIEYFNGLLGGVALLPDLASVAGYLTPI